MKQDKPPINSYHPDWTEWRLEHQGDGKFRIKRYKYIVGGHGDKVSQSLPAEFYRGMSVDEAQSLLRKRNATYERKKKEAEERYDFDHAFINKPLIEEFQRQRAFHITDHNHLKNNVMANLKRALDYYVVQKKLTSPIEWETKQFDYGQQLIEQGLSLHTIQKVQVVLNQYLEFLHKKFPQEVPLAELMLIAPAKRKLLKAEAEEDERGQFIPDAHYNLLLRYGGNIKEHIELAWWFGCRRSEVLGLQPENLFEDSLEINRQIDMCPLEGEPSFKQTKGRMKRDVPYWFTTAQSAYNSINRMKLMSKFTLTDRFSEVVEEINKREGLFIDYTFHDLRHTFITRAVRIHSLVDVSRAVGHKDIRTTQEYLEDDRELSRKRFVPRKL